jgi:mono/diheme cytochrome c family protein
MIFRIQSRRLIRGAVAALGLAVFAAWMAPAAWAQSNGSEHGVHRIKRPDQPDIVMQKMSPSRGRVYFATAACVVCHKVNGTGGSVAPPLDSIGNGDGIDVMAFVTRMWRGARSMVSLQDSLFGEAIDL